MSNKVKAQYRMRMAVGGSLVTMLLLGVAAEAAAQDTALARRDRARRAFFSDKSMPAEGKYQFVSNASFFAQLGWTNYHSPLYTDDQRFDTDGSFGPVALIAPSDDLAQLRETDFDVAGSGGRLVGAILVDTTSEAVLPDAYEGLRLSPGRNCIRLRKAHDTLWYAYVFPERATGDNLCRAPVPLPPPLRVVRVRPVADAPRAVPAVARWHEGVRGNKSRMNFGLKCVDYWCIALSDKGDTINLPHKGYKANERAWENHGWHDVQRLAVMDGTRPVPGKHQATIVPVPRLGEFRIKQDFDTGWVMVATILYRGPLSGKYAKYGRPPAPGESGYWGLQVGESHLYLRTTTDSVTYPSGWMAQIRYPHSSLPPHELLVAARDDHQGRRIPGTARFRWLDDDDGDWIRCDDGCCKIGVM